LVRTGGRRRVISLDKASGQGKEKWEKEGDYSAKDRCRGRGGRGGKG